MIQFNEYIFEIEADMKYWDDLFKTIPPKKRYPDVVFKVLYEMDPS